MKAADVREKFLRYFEKNGHTRVKSSSLIPAADPTLLFTNAGMVQFKDCFLGTRDLGFQRATTAQKCVRAGGKHNDLENVGYTPRHHTFFEMLGNFSFGDYFKEQAIAFAWELLTKEFQLPKDRLRITVFRDDDEAFELWKKQGVNPAWIERLGEKDNFWSMGDTGPCGPCTEIYFDWGAEHAEKNGGGTPGTDSSRFVEIWNNVFMQFDRSADGTMTKLPKPSVDTGAGLERMACALQGKYSNYETDLFTGLFAAIEKRVGSKYSHGPGDENTAMRVIADHLRSVSMLLTDGVVPSNEGRGYVLRRIIRRAVRYGKRLGQEKAFLCDLVPAVVASLGSQYPELVEQQKHVTVQLKEEEEKFHETLHRGMGLFEETLRAMESRNQKVLPGEVAFRLYDTFGFPYDLIELLCREKGLSADQKGFDERMEKQREQSAAGGKASATGARPKVIAALNASSVHSQFSGYESTVGKGKVVALFDAEGGAVDELALGARGYLVADPSPFYAESGGQVGDQGHIEVPDGYAQVEDTFKSASAHVCEIHVTDGAIQRGAAAELFADPILRQRTASNHTATHLLHAALRDVLGDRVRQAGSLVDPGRLRFDFTYPRALSAEEKEKIEKIVNEAVRRDSKVTKREMTYDEAMKEGALAFFDEKYGDRVRVVRVEGHSELPKEPLSVELCGGTHLDRLGHITVFRILSESSVASGVRRIEAVTGDAALKLLLERDAWLGTIERSVNAFEARSVERVQKMAADLAAAQKELDQLKTKLAQAMAGGGSGGGLHDKAKTVGSYKVVAEKLTDVDGKSLRGLVDQLRDKLQTNSIVLLAAEAGGKALLCLGVTKDLVEKLDAAKLLAPVAAIVGGTGGGRRDFAQAGGTDPSKLDEAIAAFLASLK